MEINEDLRHRIGLALNEATLLGVEFDKENDKVSCSFSLIAMDENGAVKEDNRLLFIFKSVGRFVASYRNGHWDDKEAEIQKFEPDKILEVVQSFQGLSIYGWDFINCEDDDFNTWKDRLSFDYSTNNRNGLKNTIDLFQEGGDRHIDIRIWFNDFDILTSKYEPVELEKFLENGKRGWDAVYSNSDKMSKFGIIPATSENEEKLQNTIRETTGMQKNKNWWAKIKECFKA